MDFRHSSMDVLMSTVETASIFGQFMGRNLAPASWLPLVLVALPLVLALANPCYYDGHCDCGGIMRPWCSVGCIFLLAASCVPGHRECLSFSGQALGFASQSREPRLIIRVMCSRSPVSYVGKAKWIREHDGTQTWIHIAPQLSSFFVCLCVCAWVSKFWVLN